MFNSIGGPTVDERGFMYVTDYSEFTVWVFDPDGQVVRKIGQRGRGPGEFQSPLGTLVDGDSVAVLRWRGGVSVFERDTGAYRDQHFFPTIEGQAIHQVLSRDEQGYVLKTSHVSGVRKEYLLRASLGGDEAEVLFSVPAFQQLGSGAVIKSAQFLTSSFCANSDPWIYCGHNDSLSFTILSTAGDSLGQIVIDHKPAQLSSADASSIEDRFAGTSFLRGRALPAFWPSFRGITGDDLGRLWIDVTPPKETSWTTLWIVDPKSREALEATVEGEFRLRTVRDGRAYGHGVGEAGETLVVRYLIEQN